MITQLLEGLADWDEIRFVVRNQGAIAELCGKPAVRSGEEYLTIEIGAGPDHLHVQQSALARAEIADSADRNCFVRFLNAAGDTVLTCYVPRTNRAKSDFDPARHAAFEALKARYADKPAVTVLSTT
jgi:putative heme iron utilization protein